MEIIADQELYNEEEESFQLDQIRDELEKIYLHPININSKEFEVFLRIGIINSSQYVAIEDHILKYGRIIAIEELGQIKELDKEFILLIKPFIRFENLASLPELKNAALFNDLKNDLTIHYQRMLQKREGYKGIEPFYLGDPSRIMIKYSSRFYKKWRLGLNLEKDAGEAMQFDFKRSKYGFDQQSAFLMYSGSGKLKSLILGDYQIGFGQGLTFWRGFTFGKSSNTVPVRKVGAGIKAHTGLDEFNYLRGIAFTLSNTHFTLMSFFSYRKLDANAIDSTYSTFSSIIESGYHRSISELDNEGRLGEILWGSHLKYRSRRFDIGISYADQSLSAEIAVNPNLYAINSFSGNKNRLIGMDADLSFNNGHAFFEISRSANNAYAFLAGTVITPDPKFSFSLIHRSYSSAFQSISSNAFSESSSNQNEIGTYLGAELKFSRKTMLSAYFDMFKFPWIKSRIPISSTTGSDFLLRLTHKSSKKLISSLRYRLKSDQQKETGSNLVQSRIRHQIRLENEHSINPNIKLRYRFEFQNLDFIKVRNGYLFFIDMIFQSLEKPYSISLRYALFNTDDYDTRIYAYERDAYFTYSVRPYYYKGQKIYFNFKWRMKRYFTFFFRISHTTYPFNTSIGSANDLIAGNELSEFTFQIRIRW